MMEIKGGAWENKAKLREREVGQKVGKTWLFFLL
jgi:hypothetical protein